VAYNDRNVIMEDVRLVFRNFKGAAGKFNREGERGFSVVLDEATALAMAEDGWNIKWFKPGEEGGPREAHLAVTVNFNGRPPKVIMVSSSGRTKLNEEDVELLDDVDIQTVDLIIRPYDWDVNGKTGITAYLKSIYVTLEEDELDRKYSDV
jgi:hypothetical protein